MSKIAIVRIRGKINVNKVVKDTLFMLNLHNKNYCTVVEDTPSILGMITKVKDYVTYGPISDEVYGQLVNKRGEEYKGPESDSKNKISYKRRFFEIDEKRIKKYFRLSPPIKGYGRAGIKKPYKVGGALGNRKDKINDLIMRMIG